MAEESLIENLIATGNQAAADLSSAALDLERVANELTYGQQPGFAEAVREQRNEIRAVVGRLRDIANTLRTEADQTAPDATEIRHNLARGRRWMINGLTIVASVATLTGTTVEDLAPAAEAFKYGAEQIVQTIDAALNEGPGSEQSDRIEVLVRDHVGGMIEEVDLVDDAGGVLDSKHALVFQRDGDHAGKLYALTANPGPRIVQDLAVANTPDQEADALRRLRTTYQVTEVGTVRWGTDFHLGADDHDGLTVVQGASTVRPGSEAEHFAVTLDTSQWTWRDAQPHKALTLQEAR